MPKRPEYKNLMEFGAGRTLVILLAVAAATVPVLFCDTHKQYRTY